jgi:hypothetical protein
MEMVERGEVSEVVVAHKDRLVRFGFESFEKFCAGHGTKLTVMNNPEQLSRNTSSSKTCSAPSTVPRLASTASAATLRHGKWSVELGPLPDELRTGRAAPEGCLPGRG